MASSSQLGLLCFLLVSLSLSHTLASLASPKPKALIFPVSKDAATLQYTTHPGIGTPFVQKKLVVDLGGQHFWMQCNEDYESSTFRPSPCGSAACSVAKASCGPRNCNPKSPVTPRCHNNTCTVLSVETVYGKLEVGEISMDRIAIQTTDGSKSGPPVTIPDFIFSCANAWNISNLATGSKGMVGLGRPQIALPKQLSSAFGGTLRRKFAMCLPSTPDSNGLIIFGDSPYVFYPYYNQSKSIDVTSRFQHTRLYVNTVFTGSSIVTRGPPSPEYFVKVTSILVDNKPIPINSTYLEFHQNGLGGTKISTVVPYTTLERSIYQALVKAFDEGIAAWNVTKVPPVEPFSECYTMGNLGMTLLGLSVPDITFVFENNKNVYWQMFGANTVVQVSKDVVCLAFMDGAEWPIPITSIVIGTHQLQDNLLLFDLDSSRMSFTSTLLWEEIECANFKF